MAGSMMNLLLWGLDLTFALSLLWLAWLVLTSTDLFRAIVLFIAFGLLVALVWARLGAVDVALAEAAIGAGLTGALLLTALRRMQRVDQARARHQPETNPQPSATRQKP